MNEYKTHPPRHPKNTFPEVFCIKLFFAFKVNKSIYTLSLIKAAVGCNTWQFFLTCAKSCFIRFVVKMLVDFINSIHFINKLFSNDFSIVTRLKIDNKWEWIKNILRLDVQTEN